MGGERSGLAAQIADPALRLQAHLLQVRGHSDSRGDRVTRAELARSRADAVVAHLITLGVAPARLEAYGASDSEPIGLRDDPRNARIELIILDRDSD